MEINNDNRHLLLATVNCPRFRPIWLSSIPHKDHIRNFLETECRLQVKRVMNQTLMEVMLLQKV